MTERAAAKRWTLPAVLVLGLVTGFLSAGASPASAAGVAVFPVAGSRLAAPQTQIAFRGVAFSDLQAAKIAVSGSRSGAHTGHLAPDSDGRGGSFLPDHPFTAGERVTVTTALPVLGGSGGTFSFTVAQPAGLVPYRGRPALPRMRGDVVRFHSAPSLAPDAVRVLKRTKAASPGDIFVAPQYGPLQYGPMILDPAGNLLWFDPLPGNATASDFRVQNYLGKPVLTWWQGNVNAGTGRGKDVIMNDLYQEIATVHGANGVDADLHEFELTPQGTALITAVNPVYWDARSVHGSRRQIVLDGVVQEIDIPTGLVLFQWDSLDHVGLGDTHKPPPSAHRRPYDYFHVNSVEPDKDGNLVISGRNTWAAYKVDHSTGKTIWTLGGKHSSFRMGPGASFAFQHDVRVRASNDLFVTVFDDGGGLPNVEKESRGIKLILDLRHHTARVVSQLKHSPPLMAEFEGNVQQLPDDGDFVGWGEQPYFSEYDKHGRLVFDARFVTPTANYRAYRLPWAGYPQTAPSVATARAGKYTKVYVSWNGATQVTYWRVLSGTSPSSLSPTRTVGRNGFETATQINAAPYVQVVGYDARGDVLGTSAVNTVG